MTELAKPHSDIDSIYEGSQPKNPSSYSIENLNPQAKKQVEFQSNVTEIIIPPPAEEKNEKTDPQVEYDKFLVSVDKDLDVLHADFKNRKRSLGKITSLEYFSYRDKYTSFAFIANTARLICIAQASSAAQERKFKVGRDTVTPKQANLKPKRVAELLF